MHWIALFAIDDQYTKHKHMPLDTHTLQVHTIEGHGKMKYGSNKS